MQKKAKENKELKVINENDTLNTKISTTKKLEAKKSTKTSSKNKIITNKKVSKSTSSAKKQSKVKNTIIEYYDLPDKYNQTIVKVLAQTPKTLFVYWEISDADIKNYKKQYGENFFETTKPVLIVYNNTLNYNFEVEINDFANSWYLHIDDSKSDYRIELARRPIKKNKNITSNYIHIYSSNKIESPNDHILFNNSQKMVYFKNIKNNHQIQKNISSLSLIRNMDKVYDICNLYSKFYKTEDTFENTSNPSSYILSKGTPFFDKI